jgi:hypothetical protein
MNMNLVEATNRSPISRAKGEIRGFPQTKMEMTMRKKILTMLVVPLMAAHIADLRLGSSDVRWLSETDRQFTADAESASGSVIPRAPVSAVAFSSSARNLSMMP